MNISTLLIVEDDGILAANLEAMVTRLGYGVLGPTATGEEALALLRYRSADLVIMDIELAGQLNGIETAEIITRTHGIPIIFLSGFSEESLLEEAKNIVPYGYLIKPVPEQEVAAAVAMGLHRAALDRALVESEARYRHLFEDSPLGIFRTTVDGRVLLVNREMANMVGCASPEEAIGKFNDLARQFYVNPKRRAEFIKELKARGEVRHFEYQGRKQNGELIWISMNARLQAMPDLDGETVTAIDGFAQDITAEKIARQDLHESEERFRTIFECNTAVMLLLDAATGAIIAANPSAVAFYGWSIDQLRQMHIQEINTMPLEMLQLQMRQVITSESTRFECLHRCADGSIRDVEVFSSPVKIGGRQLLFSIIHDITGRKQAEEEKKSLQAQLAQAQKLEAIGTLSGGIAHDFNNIISIILGYADLARGSCAPGSSGARYLDQITSAGERARDLVQQILTFSRQARTATRVLFPAQIVREVARMLRPTLPSTIDIVTEIDERAGPVEIDPTQLHQILMNLATNAFHAMEQRGGSLRLALAVHSWQAEQPLGETGSKSEQFVRLSVSDTGVGIAPDILDRIFDPFFTTKEPGKGTGMGLATVHGIVKGCGGFVTVNSVLGQGSEIHVHLPIATGEVPAQARAETEPPPGTGHILFVDDEAMLTEMATTLLEGLGYQVTACGNSAQALEVFTRQPQAFDLVITDQTMPGMTGVELAQQLLKIRPELPVILCTGYNPLVSEAQALAMGIRAYVPKPFSSVQMARLLHSILAP